MTWDGSERRVVDQRFEIAMDDVHELQGNVSGLRRDMRLFNKIVGLVTVIVILLIVTTIAQLNDLHNRAVTNRVANRVAQQVTLNAVNCILHSIHEQHSPPPEETDIVKNSCAKLDELLKSGAVALSETGGKE